MSQTNHCAPTTPQTKAISGAPSMPCSLLKHHPSKRELTFKLAHKIKCYQGPGVDARLLPASDTPCFHEEHSLPICQSTHSRKQPMSIDASVLTFFQLRPKLVVWSRIGGLVVQQGGFPFAFCKKGCKSKSKPPIQGYLISGSQSSSTRLTQFSLVRTLNH